LFLPFELTFTTGASLNFVRYNIQDNLTNSANPNHADQSGVINFTPVITPRVAVMKTINQHLSAHAQVSRGYSPPGSSILVSSQIGPVNRELQPERATLYEIGTKGSLMNGRFAFDLAVFDMKVSDKLTPETVVSGTVLYANAGRQSNRGLEFAARYAVINQPNSLVSSLGPFITYTFSSFRYDDFKSYDNNKRETIDYSGKKVVGVPPHLLNLGLDLTLKGGFYLNGSYQYVDSMPLTFDNSQQAKSYSLLNAKLGYATELSHFQLDFFAGVKNLLGSLYYTMVFLNANYQATDGSALHPNVYLPGPYTPTFFGGVNLSYRL
jgi:iron complex outermembrane receptor protein